MKLKLQLCSVFGLIMLADLANSQVQSYCDMSTSVCTVPNASSSASVNDGVIEDVIAEAVQFSANEIVFPAGTFKISKSIVFNDTTNGYKLKISGAGIGNTIIWPDIPTNPSNPSAPFFPIFNIAGSGQFPLMEMEISGFTIEMDHLANHPAYVDSTITTSNAHGIRVGQGWGSVIHNGVEHLGDPDGFLMLKDLKIEGPTGYGVGIQTRGSNRYPADNVIIENVVILRAGSDGIDTKESSFRNAHNITIRGVAINEFGLNEKDASRTNTYANGLDLRYEGVHIEAVSIITQPSGGNVVAAHSQYSSSAPNFFNTTTNNGINFRNESGIGSKTAGKNAIVRDVYVKGTNHAINFGGSTAEDVIVTNFILKSYEGNGITIRGKEHVFLNGCILPSGTDFVHYVAAESEANTIVEKLELGQYSASLCPAYDEVGFISW